MADARSLLRQQRAARRIEHPYAAYSEAGKLLCTLCREQIKNESLWDSHLQSSTHKQRTHYTAAGPSSTGPSSKASHDAAAVEGAPESQSAHKRKFSDQEDGDVEMDDAVRRKKSRADMASDDTTDAKEQTPPDVQNGRSKSQSRTPPNLATRTSNTPSQGVELQIPSRPATPGRRDGSSSSTPKSGLALSRAAHKASTSSGRDAEPPAASSTAPDVDESEWAAFEADIAATSAPYDQDAVISAPAMTAEEAAEADATRHDHEDQERRRAKADIDLAGEKEDASRAMEDEFDEMQELEARVRKLKERREAIRQRTRSQGQDENDAPTGASDLGVKAAEGDAEAVEDDDEDDDEEEDDDDWDDGFRFTRG